MVTNQQIRQAITNGFAIGNGWIVSTSNQSEEHNYLDVFEKTYPEKSSIEKVTVTVIRDKKIKSIRLYVCIKFVQKFPSENWMEDFWNARPQPNGIPEPQEIKVEQRTLQRNATKSGNAVHAILINSNWRTWTTQNLNNNLDVLRNCCEGLCKWADAYVSTLP